MTIYQRNNGSYFEVFYMDATAAARWPTPLTPGYYWDDWRSDLPHGPYDREGQAMAYGIDHINY